VVVDIWGNPKGNEEVGITRVAEKEVGGIDHSRVEKGVTNLTKKDRWSVYLL